VEVDGETRSRAGQGRVGGYLFGYWRSTTGPLDLSQSSSRCQNSQKAKMRDVCEREGSTIALDYASHYSMRRGLNFPMSCTVGTVSPIAAGNIAQNEPITTKNAILCYSSIESSTIFIRSSAREIYACNSSKHHWVEAAGDFGSRANWHGSIEIPTIQFFTR
jgi:hypothetical protein